MLSDNIRRIRLDHNLSQASFGYILHVSQSAVSQWEKGTTRPDTDMLRAISLAFDTPMDDIMQDEPIPSFREFSVNQAEAPLSPTEEKLIRSFRSMNQTGQERIIMIVDDYTQIYKKTYNPTF